MGIFSSVREGVECVYSLATGMFITGKNFAKPQITVHYPRQQVNNLQSYRSHIELIPEDNDASLPRCVACHSCEKSCPSQCITVKSGKELQKKSKKDEEAQPNELLETQIEPPRLGSFELDFSKCSLCGLCVLSCPVDAIQFSTNSYLTTFERDSLKMDLIARMKSEPPAPREIDAGFCKVHYDFEIDPKLCKGCSMCVKACPMEATSGEKKQPHEIDKKLCVNCGQCYRACKFVAVTATPLP